MLHRAPRPFLLGATLLAFLTTPPAPADDNFLMPDWAGALPEAGNVTTTASAAQADTSSIVPLPMATVIGLYQEQLRKAGVESRTSFDGLGNTISATTGKAICIIRVAEVDRGSRVKASCAPKSEAPAPREPNANGWTVGGTATPVSVQPQVQPPQAVPSQPALQVDLTEVKSDLAAIQSEIAEAQKIDAQYSGGLVKALSSSRIATLRQTEAVLEQKLLSYKAGAPALRLSAADSQKLAEVESEISSTRRKIRQQQLEVARYSGGLTYAMSLATLETLRQTLAMLEQRRILLKYDTQQLVAGRPASVEAEPKGPRPAPIELRSVGATEQQAAQPGIHAVEYSIDGSAAEVGITARNSEGGTEQHEVSVPYHRTFYASDGAFVYLAAQKKGKNGTIHVSIRVDGRLLQEATASSPYGIA